MREKLKQHRQTLQEKLQEGLYRLMQPIKQPAEEAADSLLPSRRREDNYRREKHDEQMMTLDFAADADIAIGTQNPLRSRAAVKLLMYLMGAFLLWAMLARVDELTKGEGKVIPSRQVQVIQSLDGGIISEILVREGQSVSAGEVLVRIDPTRFISGFRESRATYLALLAKAARLKAVAEGSDFVPPPDVAKEAPDLIREEQSLYANRVAELESQVSMARVQVQQRSQELNEASARYSAATQGFDLTTRELQLTKPLVESGAVSDVDLLRLQRDISRYSGERNQSSAQMSRLRAAISEAQTKIENVELEFRNQARTELAEVQSKINSLGESSVALSDKVKQADIKSPVNGTVKRLLFNTVGGVVPPGKDIIEIVPTEDALLLEAKVSPRDIAFLRPGQAAKVKFTAYDFAIYGALDGTLEHISADSLIDDKGNTYYVVRVRTTRSSLGKDLPIIPGMVAEVDILTGKKTVLTYLLKPVLRATQYAMTER